MSESAFDPTMFLDATTTEAATRRPPLPAGDYVGLIGELKSPRSVQGKKDPTQTYVFMDIPIEIDLSTNPTVQSSIGQPKVTLVYGISVDASPTGGFDWSPGKNSGMRQLREATGHNVPGKPFSPRMLQGCMIRVRVTHEIYEGDIRDKISSVAKI